LLLSGHRVRFAFSHGRKLVPPEGPDRRGHQVSGDARDLGQPEAAALPVIPAEGFLTLITIMGLRGP